MLHYLIFFSCLDGPVNTGTILFQVNIEASPWQDIPLGAAALRPYLTAQTPANNLLKQSEEKSPFPSSAPTSPSRSFFRGLIKNCLKRRRTTEVRPLAPQKGATSQGLLEAVWLQR